MAKLGTKNITTKHDDGEITSTEALQLIEEAFEKGTAEADQFGIQMFSALDQYLRAGGELPDQWKPQG